MLGCLASWSSAETKVTGDAQLLKQLQQGIAAKRSEFPKGELICRVRDEHLGFDGHPEGLFDQTIAQVRMVWVGDHSYWEYRHEFHDYLTHIPERPELHTTHKDVYAIRLPGKRYTFKPHLGRAGYLSENVAPKTEEAFLRLHPHDRWYRKEDSKRHWDEYIDPEKLSEYVVRIEVQRDGDRVLVKRMHRDGSAMDMVFSLAHGGNLVSYQSRASNGGATWDGYAHKGEYEWLPTGQGSWRLKRMAFQQSEIETPDEPFWVFEIQVESFNPSPDVDRDQFTLAALPLKENTLVQRRTKDRKGDKRWRYGSGETGGDISADRLESLGEELKQHKFANP